VPQSSGSKNKIRKQVSCFLFYFSNLKMEALINFYKISRHIEDLNTVTYMGLHVMKIMGSRSDDWIY
jgi:hypothetical protein